MEICVRCTRPSYGLKCRNQLSSLCPMVFLYIISHNVLLCMQAQHHNNAAATQSNTPTVHVLYCTNVLYMYCTTVYTTVSTQYKVTNIITLYISFCIVCIFIHHNKKHSCSCTQFHGPLHALIHVLKKHCKFCLREMGKTDGLRNTRFMAAILWDVMPCWLVGSFNTIIKYRIIF